MTCGCNKKYEKLTADKPENTKIFAGQASFSIEQLEREMSDDKSDVGRKLKSVEKDLENY
jgi:hypothetical protein